MICVCVYNKFTPRLFTFKKGGYKIMDFDFEFDELTELEIMDLENSRDELILELESGCSLSRESEILNKLNLIQEQLDNLY